MILTFSWTSLLSEMACELLLGNYGALPSPWHLRHCCGVCCRVLGWVLGQNTSSSKLCSWNAVLSWDLWFTISALSQTTMICSFWLVGVLCAVLLGVGVKQEALWLDLSYIWLFLLSVYMAINGMCWFWMSCCLHASFWGNGLNKLPWILIY